MEKERTSPWLILFRVVFTAALIACIMFIFRNSLENGAQSSARSQAVMQMVNSALAKVHLGPLSEHLIRKLAHFSEFALEGFLLMLCIRVYTKHFVRHMSWPLLGGMTTALMDETIQLHSPNRTSSVVDVWIDMSGVVAGLLFALIILLIVRGVTAFIRVKQENRALRAEVHIRLVDDDNAVLIVLQQVLEELERHTAAGRRVRVRQDDTAVRLVVITHIDAEILVERHVFVRNAEQIAPDRIERIGDVWIENRLVRAEE